MPDGCAAVCKLQDASDCLKLLEPKFRTFPEIRWMHGEAATLADIHRNLQEAWVPLDVYH